MSDEKTNVMTDKEEKILKSFAVILPKLSESDKSYFLGFCEGIRMKKRGEEDG